MSSYEGVFVRSAALWGRRAQRADEEDGATESDLFSEVGNDLEVVVDRWTVGQLGITELIASVVLLAAGAVLYWLVQRVAHRVAQRSKGVASGATEVAGRIVGVGLVLFSVAVALEVLGFTLGPVLVLLLVFIVGLLIMRPVITGLSTGLLLQARSGLRSGDVITTNGIRGTVEEINARTVVLTTPDGRQVHIPNTDVLDCPIENHTATGRLRSTMELTIESPEDTEAALAALETSLRAVAPMLETPAPEVGIVRIDGCHVVMHVLFWHDPRPPSVRQARHEVARAAVAALTSEGIRLADPWPTLTSGRQRGSPDQRDQPAGEDR